ncbi:hypothetical protein H5202_16195 [Shewanella sp. SG41-4]|uniref:hypothetical protein n=1 Tax=Shewanella sp. SG41-4 TaxID=2760976 RepID=UPI0015FF9E32|nr:hypothetical protein [Shewanella sp. SG41-4]MBB1440187.1 hypothetical protein [Shewanella sp. SG41-4]
MNLAKYIILLSVIYQLIGCSSEESPSQVYEEYNIKVLNSISYEDDKAYYSKRKQEETESKFPQYLKQMGKSRDEVIEFYLNVSSEVARCKKITLASEVIDANTATLEYSQKDICGNQSSAEEKQIIKMINEGGWKIDDVEISL